MNDSLVPIYPSVRRSKQVIAEGRRLRAEAERLLAEARRQLNHLERIVSEARRERESGFQPELREAIRAMYDCESRHVASFAVHKVCVGKIEWGGLVEEFALISHPEAIACYAWHYAEDGQPRSFTLLKLPPVDSPQKAVQFSLTAREHPLENMAA